MQTALLVSTLAILISVLQGYKCELTDSPYWRPQNVLQLNQIDRLVTTSFQSVDLVIDSTDKTVSRTINNYGSWYPRDIINFAYFIKEGDAVLNAGSHVGLQAMVGGRIIGPKGKLFIFEPVRKTYQIVLENIYLNGLQGITQVYNLGQKDLQEQCFKCSKTLDLCSNKESNRSDKYSTGTIAIPKDNTGASTIYTNESFESAPKNKWFLNQQVQTDRMDNILPEDTVLNVALIDVERLQIECLEGLMETMKRSPDLMMCVEWMGISVNNPDIEERKNKLVDWFISREYRFYKLPQQQNVCQVGPFQQVQKKDIVGIRVQSDIADVWFFPKHIDPNNFKP